jgi:hypothetical protein
VTKGKIVSHERFLMYRSAAELQKAADGLRAMTRAFGHFSEVVDDACDEAKRSLTLAERTLVHRSEIAAEERTRTLDVLEEGDLDSMLAERERLLKAERLGCRTCESYAPGERDGCSLAKGECPREKGV